MTANCPYPNVRRSGSGWAAYLPVRASSRYLGTFTRAEDAAVTVLSAQAAGHEARAQQYRDRAEELQQEKSA